MPSDENSWLQPSREPTPVSCKTNARDGLASLMELPIVLRYSALRTRSGTTGQHSKANPHPKILDDRRIIRKFGFKFIHSYNYLPRTYHQRIGTLAQGLRGLSRSAAADILIDHFHREITARRIVFATRPPTRGGPLHPAFSAPGHRTPPVPPPRSASRQSQAH